MLFLSYGLNANNDLIYIEEVGRGVTDLRCPYCGGQLMARKGDVLVHHFAHIGETCRQVLSSNHKQLDVPVYDKFDLGVRLSNDELAFLEDLYQQNGGHRFMIDHERLLYNGFIEANEYLTRRVWYSVWDCTSKGKIAIGRATLQKFAEIQRDIQQARYQKLVDNIAYIASQKVSTQGVIGDFRIYRAQLRRIYTASLYFLEVKHSEGILYKIGVTRRDIAARIEEIRHDLAPHLTDIKIKPLRFLKNRGSIEFYFKYRYRAHQYPLGSLTEYFQFEDRRNVLSDLSRLGDYALDTWLNDILSNQSDVENSFQFAS